VKIVKIDGKIKNNFFKGVMSKREREPDLLDISRDMVAFERKFCRKVCKTAAGVFDGPKDYYEAVTNIMEMGRTYYQEVFKHCEIGVIDKELLINMGSTLEKLLKSVE
jgi:hypothetical protein